MRRNSTWLYVRLDNWYTTHQSTQTLNNPSINNHYCLLIWCVCTVVLSDVTINITHIEARIRWVCWSGQWMGCVAGVWGWRWWWWWHRMGTRRVVSVLALVSMATLSTGEWCRVDSVMSCVLQDYNKIGLQLTQTNQWPIAMTYDVGFPFGKSGSLPPWYSECSKISV